MHIDCTLSFTRSGLFYLRFIMFTKCTASDYMAALHSVTSTVYHTLPLHMVYGRAYTYTLLLPRIIAHLCAEWKRS